MNMTGKERMITALSLGEPDRVPVWETAYNEESIIKIGRVFTDQVPPVKSVHRMNLEESLRVLEVLYMITRELELDGLTSHYLWESQLVDDSHVKDNWGRIYYLDKEGEAVPVKGPVSGPDDLKNLKLFHPRETEFLMLMVSIDRLGKDLAHVVYVIGPFRESWAMLGSIEKLLYYFKKKPDFVKDLARIVTDYILEVIDKSADLGADIIALGSDLAFNQSTLMSPAQYEDLVLPYHKEITALVHKRGMKIIKHSDGNMWPIMEGMVEAGFDGLHPIQPQCMNIAEVKAKYGKRICLIGNIDCAVPPFGSEEDIEKTVKETIAIAAPGGGYIISSSNSIHPGCKGENYVAMVRAARKYGKYPLQISG